MAITTVYDIRVNMVMQDRATKGANAIAGSAKRASTGLDGLGRSVMRVGSAIAAYFGARALKSSFIDFNAGIEQATISLATQEKMMLGGRWDTAMQHATQLHLDYQQVAKKSVGETQDFITMHRAIQAAALQTGATMAQVKSMATGGTIVSQVFGERSDITSLDIKQMLMGTVTARDRVATMLLASQGLDNKKFNAMSADKRRGVVLTALNDPAIKDAAKALENSFSGATSTLSDNLKIGLGKVGLPLFKAITEEVKRWNQWIDKNPEKIKTWAVEFGGALVSGFRMMLKAGAFIAQHKDLLMSIAKAALVFKAGSTMAKVISSPFVMLANFRNPITAAAGATNTFATRMNGLAGKVQGWGMVFSGVAAAASGFAGMVLAEQEKDIGANAEQSDMLLRDHLAMVAAQRFTGNTREKLIRQVTSDPSERAKIRNRYDTSARFDLLANTLSLDAVGRARADGIVGRNGQINEKAFRKAMGVDKGIYDVTGLQTYKALEDLLRREQQIRGEQWGRLFAALQNSFSVRDLSMRQLYDGTATVWNAALSKLGLGATDPNAKKAIKPSIDVKMVNEIYSDDPDRFVMQMEGILEDAVRNPTSSIDSFRRV